MIGRPVLVEDPRRLVVNVARPEDVVTTPDVCVGSTVLDEGTSPEELVTLVEDDEPSPVDTPPVDVCEERIVLNEVGSVVKEFELTIELICDESDDKAEVNDVTIGRPLLLVGAPRLLEVLKLDVRDSVESVVGSDVSVNTELLDDGTVGSIERDVEMLGSPELVEAPPLLLDESVGNIVGNVVGRIELMTELRSETTDETIDVTVVMIVSPVLADDGPITLVVVTTKDVVVRVGKIDNVLLLEPPTPELDVKVGTTNVLEVNVGTVNAEPDESLLTCVLDATELMTELICDESELI